MALYNVRYFKKIISDPSKSLAIGLNNQNLSLSKQIDEYTLSKKICQFLEFLWWGLC